MRNIEPEKKPCKGPLQVAVAAIVNDLGQVLISRRPDHVHQGGLWEFPGGKLEPDETVAEALNRELQEELGVGVLASRPLIRIRHRYGEQWVELNVLLVEELLGIPSGIEGQEVEWVALQTLAERSFPAANQSIIHALRLPSRYLITPEPDQVGPGFMQDLEQVLGDERIRLVQLRAKELSAELYCSLAREVLDCCGRYGATLLLNESIEIVREVGADGVHLSTSSLMGLDTRPLDSDHWVAASCHNQDEIDHAERIGVDFIVLSPVRVSLTHPSTDPIGWQGFKALCDLAALPVYALGGMEETDLDKAYRCGAQGISAIRGLWPASARC